MRSRQRTSSRRQSRRPRPPQRSPEPISNLLLWTSGRRLPSHRTPPNRAKESRSNLRPVPADDAPPTDWTIAVATVEITDSGADIVADRRPGHAHIGKLTVTGIDATPTTWKVGSVDLVDGSAKASLRTGDTHIEIPTLTVTGLTSNPASPLKIVGRIKEDSAVIDVDADVVLEPQSVQAKLNLENVALGRYADLSGMSPVHMPTGTLQAALAIDVAGDDANLSGQIALEDLQVLTQDGKQDFAVAWETLAIDIRSFHANVAEPEAPMSLELADFHLTGPKIRATLTADGIVLPTVRVDAAAAGALAEDSGAPAAGEPELQDASATETADADQPHDAVIRSGLVAQTEAVGVDEIAKFAEPAANLPIGLVVDRLRIQNGEFRVVDRAVKPTYRGKVTDFHFDISGVALPADVPPSETVFEKMSLDLRAPGDALVKVRAGTAAQGVRIDANVEKLPLSQFNPYVQQAAGYTVLAGAATVESTVLWAKDRYDSDTDITLSALDVGNAKGGSLFKDYFGISISAALALLSDITGKIDLGIPVSGTTEGTEIGIGSVVEQALTKAHLGCDHVSAQDAGRDHDDRRQSRRDHTVTGLLSCRLGRDLEGRAGQGRARQQRPVVVPRNQDRVGRPSRFGRRPRVEGSRRPRRPRRRERLPRGPAQPREWGYPGRRSEKRFKTTTSPLSTRTTRPSSMKWWPRSP